MEERTDAEYTTYLFNGKELDEETGLYYYGVRYYDPKISMFYGVDPMADKFAWVTPYNYAENEPVANIDLWGLQKYYAANGSLIGSIGTNSQVRLVSEGNVKTVSFWINAANNPPKGHDESYMDRATDRANTFSSEVVGMTNDELNTRATLATLKQTEAGSANQPLDYNSWNEGMNFTEKSYEEDPSAYSQHPGANENSKNPKGRTSAGAYQFLERYYKGKDFSPATQDKAAVDLMGSKGRMAAKSGDVLQIKSTLSGKWTSLKHWSQSSLEKVFKKNISDELNNKSKIAAPKGELTGGN